MASDNEEMPPSGSAPPITTTAAGAGPPGPGAGISTTASSAPDTQAVSLPGVPQQQYVISGSNSGAFSGGVTTTNVNNSSVTTPLVSSTDTTALANLLHSGILPPMQMADLQHKLAALSMGGLAMPMPPINVTPLPLFKTPDTSGFLELGALIQALPQVSGNAAQPVNQNAVVSVVRVLANEHRELMVDRREAGIYKQVKLLTNSMSSSSLVSRRGIEMFSTFLSSRC